MSGMMEGLRCRQWLDDKGPVRPWNGLGIVFKVNGKLWNVRRHGVMCLMITLAAVLEKIVMELDTRHRCLLCDYFSSSAKK